MLHVTYVPSFAVMRSRTLYRVSCMIVFAYDVIGQRYSPGSSQTLFLLEEKSWSLNGHSEELSCSTNNKNGSKQQDTFDTHSLFKPCMEVSFAAFDPFFIFTYYIAVEIYFF